MANSGLQYDELNRPYFLMPDGRKNYVSPAAMGQPGEQTGLGQGGSFLHSPGQWNQYSGQVERPINWGNLISAGVAAGLTGGAANAAGLFGGGGSALLGEGGSAAGLSASGATPGLIGGASGAAGAAAGGGGVLSSLPSWVGPAAALGIPTVGRALTSGNGSPTSGSGGVLSPEVLQLLQEFIRRQQNQAPLADAVTAQALGGLPRAR